MLTQMIKSYGIKTASPPLCRKKRKRKSKRSWETAEPEPRRRWIILTAWQRRSGCELLGWVFAKCIVHGWWSATLLNDPYLFTLWRRIQGIIWGHVQCSWAKSLKMLLRIIWLIWAFIYTWSIDLHVNALQLWDFKAYLIEEFLK